MDTKTISSIIIFERDIGNHLHHNDKNDYRIYRENNINHWTVAASYGEVGWRSQHSTWITTALRMQIQNDQNIGCCTFPQRVSLQRQRSSADEYVQHFGLYPTGLDFQRRNLKHFRRTHWQPAAYYIQPINGTCRLVQWNDSKDCAGELTFPTSCMQWLKNSLRTSPTSFCTWNFRCLQSSGN